MGRARGAALRSQEGYRRQLWRGKHTTSMGSRTILPAGCASKKGVIFLMNLPQAHTDDIPTTSATWAVRSDEWAAVTGMDARRDEGLAVFPQACRQTVDTAVQGWKALTVSLTSVCVVVLLASRMWSVCVDREWGQEGLGSYCSASQLGHGELCIPVVAALVQRSGYGEASTDKQGPPSVFLSHSTAGAAQSQTASDDSHTWVLARGMAAAALPREARKHRQPADGVWAESGLPEQLLPHAGCPAILPQGPAASPGS